MVLSQKKSLVYEMTHKYYDAASSASTVSGTWTLIQTSGKGLLTFNVPTHCPDSVGVTGKLGDSHF